MKKILFATLIVFVLFFTSCVEDPRDAYKEYPFKGKTYSGPTCNANQLTGTYLMYDGYYGGSDIIDYGEYYLVSFKSDNTCIVTFASGNLWDYYKSGYYEGTYADNGTTFTINFGTYSYTGIKSDLVYKATGLKAGFSAGKSDYNSIRFLKMSDSIIDTSYWTRSRLNLFCGVSNDFGETKGYRFLNDGTYYYYSSSGSVFEGTYVIYQNTIKLSEELLYGAYNFSVFGNYIAIGDVYYKII